MARLVAISMIVACSGRTHQPPPPPPPAVVGVHVEERVEARHAEGYAPGPHFQPAYIKLKLGHYRNEKLGIGVTIDLTEVSASEIPPARLRFDGEPKIWRLTGQHGGSGRIDYAREDGRLVLQVWKDGRRAVFIHDHRAARSSDAIEVERDADADPLRDGVQ